MSPQLTCSVSVHLLEVTTGARYERTFPRDITVTHPETRELRCVASFHRLSVLIPNNFTVRRKKMAALTHLGLKQTLGQPLILCLLSLHVCFLLQRGLSRRRSLTGADARLLCSCERRHRRRLTAFGGRQHHVTRGAFSAGTASLDRIVFTSP